MISIKKSKKQIRLLSLLLAIFIVLGMFPAMAQPALAADAESPAVTASGNCGSPMAGDVQWTLYEDGLFIICGTGAMEDYSTAGGVPWREHNSKIKEVEIEDGVTFLAGRAFYSCASLTAITIPGSVAEIGQATFFQCTGLNRMTFKGTTPPTIGTQTFMMASSTGTIHCPAGTSESYTGWKDAIGAGYPLNPIKGWAVEEASSGSQEEAPAISGPETMSLDVGYTAASTGEYTITGKPAPTVTKESGDPLITWNDATRKLDIAASLGVGAYPVLLKAANGVSPDVTLTFTLTVEEASFGSQEEAPGISGPKTMLIGVGYVAASTDEYTITGEPSPTVTKESGDALITWNATTKRLDIAEGLDTGIYQVVLKASNGVSPDAMLTFTLRVSGEGTTVVAGGACGPDTGEIDESYKKIYSDSVTWTLFDDGKLIITGEGPMGDFYGGAPWFDRNSTTQLHMETAVIEEGVTRIGITTFGTIYYYYSPPPNLTSVNIPKSVTEIGFGAFDGCDTLNRLTFLGSTPPVAEKSTGSGKMPFFGVSPTGTIYCPAGAMGAYNSWKNTVDLSGWMVSAVTDDGTLTFPVITGPETMWLAKGYEAASTEIFSVKGAPEPVVNIICTSDIDGKITWDTVGKKLEIDEGLAPGEYDVELTATNSTGSSSMNFTLTVYWHEIPVGEKNVSAPDSIFNSWLINGAEIIDCKMSTDPVGNGENYHRTFDIILADDTDWDVPVNIFWDCENTYPFDIFVSRRDNAGGSDGKAIDFKLEDGAASQTLYIHYAGIQGAAKVVTKNVFNFTVAEPDASGDPDPDTVASIAITTPPNKTTYLDGSYFVRFGMTVTATLKDGGRAPVAGYAVTPETLALGTTEVTVTFGVGANTFTAKQAVTVLPAMAIDNVTVVNGQLMGGFANQVSAARLVNTYDAVVLYGQSKVNISFEVGESVEVYIGAEQQTVTDGVCTLQLDASRDGTSTVATLKTSGAADVDYAFICYTQQYSGMPSRVEEYFVVASQYTNFAGYALNPVATLRGVNSINTTMHPSTGLNAGPKSLGGFGGYITYYYDTPIIDNPNNPYGIDFIVYGNSVEGSNAFAEPGNVLVSEDGEKWYTLAGSLHYEDVALWNYSMTYTRESNDMTAWSDSNGTIGTMQYPYPSPEHYPLFPWIAGQESRVTLTGTLLVPESVVNEYGNTEPPFPHFGYADCGIIGDSNEAYNPYLGVVFRNGRTFSERTDGFDLKWAVDESGQPVDLSSAQIRYVKVQNANNIDNGGIGEKSPEIHMIRVAKAVAENVGVTTAPSSIKVNGIEVNLQSGTFVYDDVAVPASGAFIVSVEAEGANIYINGSRGTSATFPKAPNHQIIRVIVQEGEKAPAIYYLNLTEDPDTSGLKYSEITFDAWGGSVNGKPTDTVIYTAESADKSFTTPTYTNRKFLGWFDEADNKHESYSEDMPAELTVTARWEYILQREEPIILRVSFRLIGATKSQVMGRDGDNIDLGAPEGYKGSRYVTWIPTRTYTMNKGDTMYDLFVKAIMDARLDQKGAEKNYVSSIKAPFVHGGGWLAEFTNGKRSGWMYTVGKTDSAADQKHPDRGLREYDLKDGDVVIWHYVNDYGYEIADWFDDPDYPSLHDGDKVFWNRWLDAPDEPPTKDNAPATGGNVQEKTVTLAPKATVKGGAAEASVSFSEMEKAINEVKKDGGDAIVIKPGISGQADKISVELPKTSISSMVSETDATLKVETPMGTINIPQDALAAIATQASGSTVTMSLESMDKSSLTPTQQEMVGDKPVYDISIMSGSSHISSFNGKSITISLPYTLKAGESTDNVKVWYLNDAGELEEMDCSYDEKTGLATFKTDHLSYYLVGVEVPEEDDFINPFTDVEESDWFYEAVKFAVENSLFKGTGETTFNPNEPMTRAMLVTVLHRLEGSPETTGANNFTDVKNGQWYAKAVLWANTNDIVSGYGNGLFGTDDPVTREQMAAILYRYASYKGYDVTAEANLSTYTDAPEISSWAKKSMSWANAEGLITGRTATTLAPLGNSTRAEVATILKRFVEGFVK